MASGAQVHSMDAVRDFRAALLTFAQEVREAMASYDMEVGRSLDFILDAQPARWKMEVRKCEETVNQAKHDLEHRQSVQFSGQANSCAQERKALDRAKERLRYALEKVEVVRKWGHVVDREASEFRGRATQFSGTLDVELPRAVSELNRVLTTLEAYLSSGFEEQGAAASAAGPVTEGSVALPAVEEPAPLHEPTVQEHEAADVDAASDGDAATSGAGATPHRGDQP